MTAPQEAVWNWFKGAPLPVVLALTLGLAGWVYALEDQVSKQGAQVAVAAEQSKVAAETTKRLEDKVDKLLEIVIAREAAEAEKDKAEQKAAKKEKK